MTDTIPGYNCTVAELFEWQVKKGPQHKAVSFNDTTLTYQALNEKANQFAHWLQNQNVKPGEIIGILLEPGIDFIISILAVIKTGAVYLPLDALAPHKRLSDILNDAAPRLILTGEEFAYHFTEREHRVRLIRNLHLESAVFPRENLKHCLSPVSPIYMIYTSGSTGRPKGVILSHRGVVNLVAVENLTHVNKNTIFAQFSSLAFDASPYEIWSALLNGATLAVVPQDTRQDHTKLKLFLEKNDVKHLFLPTGFFHQITKSVPDTLNSVDIVVFGGEQVNKTLLKNFISYRKTVKLPITLINAYGPSEATTITCRQVMDTDALFNDEQMSSIGQPIKNIRTYILDENKNPVSEGELYISGVNLAISYHNSIQNQERFMSNPFCQDEPYQMLYKTGDKVRKLISDDLLYLGRVDDQVKIGGFRIHLNEIENHLMQYPSISLAAVKVEMGGGSHQMLAAYIVLSSENLTIDADEIRGFLSGVLPPYMLPAKYILVSELPLTLVGKVDKDKLDKIPHTDLSFHIDTSSSSPIEETINGIWQHLLNRSFIDVNKNLFDLGANSLLVIEACARINESLQSELQVSNIFSYPTIHKLSRYLEGDIEKTQIREAKKIASSDIAIIGMSCRFPKANSLQEFWNNLCQAEEGLTRFNEEELSKTVEKYKIDDKNFVPVRGILNDIDKFDANFFGFSPIDASVTDPQQRVFLECAWEALEDAGVAPSKMVTKKISVFAGMAESAYLHENLLRNNWFCNEHDRLHQRIVSGSGVLSTQVSYRLNLRGRSLNINTACSTGLVTVAQACQDLMFGSSDIALAGAVSIVVPQIDGYLYQNGSIESPDGRCRPFSEEANGTVFSNGVGVVILKRLADAIDDNDTIYAVINGSGVNNDGSDKLGYTAPSTSGQIACIQEALGQAGINARDVGYIETHGTATAMGDMVEIDALSTVYSEYTEDKQFCILGSVKGNIGHTDVAAGIAGLIKTALCLYHHKIPPTLHYKKSNQGINFTKSPFFINNQLMNWETDANKRYAGVSAFGVGGTNAHLIVSEHTHDSLSTRADAEQLIILSAKTEQALEQNTQKLVQYLSQPSTEKTSPNYLADVAFTLQTGREDFQWRRMGIGKNPSEILKNLPQSTIKLCSENIHHNIVFMFPGQGMQYHNMATQLMDEIPYFSSIVEAGICLANKYLHCDLLAILKNPED